MAKAPPQQNNLVNGQKELITALESLRSVYPEARLHDYQEDGEENPVLLNYTILGSESTKEE